MFEAFTCTDWLLISVLWVQVANILVAVWPRLSRLRHRNQIIIAESEQIKKSVKKDAYEKLLDDEKHDS